MKKTISKWSSLGLVLLCLSAYAQSKVELGLRIIPQATTFRYTSGLAPAFDFLKATAPYYFRVRSAQGIGITYNPLQRLRIGIDLLYSLQGGGYKTRKANLGYIKFPLWIGYNASAKRKLIFCLQSGVELSYLLHAQVRSQDKTLHNIKPYLRSVSWGIPLAIGFKFKVAHSYYITTQLYLYSDFVSLAKTSDSFGVYNYVYPGFRISIDQNLSHFVNKK